MQLTISGRYKLHQSDQSSSDDDVLFNNNNNDTNQRPMTLYGIAFKPTSRVNHDDNNNKKIPNPPPLPPVTPTLPRSATLKSTSDFDIYNQHSSPNYCKLSILLLLPPPPPPLSLPVP